MINTKESINQLIIVESEEQIFLVGTLDASLTP